MDGLFGEAESALSMLVGQPARFRDDQWEAVEALVAARRRVLVVQRTGWGKSAVYFVATALLRARGFGPTLLVSPLLGLMRNQIAAAERGGVRTQRIASDNPGEWETITEALRNDELDVLLVAPERFANAAFRRDVLPLVTERAGLLVIDEAHCISDWGHDFRPDYRRLARVIDLIPAGVPVLCTTATANDRVVNDIVEQFGGDLLVLRGSLDRESLALDVLHLPSQADRLAWLAQRLPELPGTGIVYALTVEDARRIADWLQSRGIEARAYFGAEGTDAKLEIEAQLLANELKCVVATSALGMGYDKPDLSFVVHFQMPGSAIALYQQIGRAGRAIDRAYAIGLAGDEDARIQNWFIDTAFPSREHVDEILRLLADTDDWVRLATLEEHVNLRRTRLLAALKVLEVEGAVEADGWKWRRTAKDWEYPAARVTAVTGQRREEQERMREFLATDDCLMQFLLHELDEKDAEPCGRCARCLGSHLVSDDVDPAIVEAAVQFLRGQNYAIDPRAQRPGGGLPKAERNEAGLVLSIYDDGGWGALVKADKTVGAYSDTLVDALVELAGRATFEARPEWVTWVPSEKPELVASLAERVAGRLGLPFVRVVEQVRATEAQELMANSAQQYGNVADAFAIIGEVPSGLVFLIDDIVDSRWTLTVVGQLLRQKGSGPVVPLVLARAAG
jgi:ATP-dependent DNA helicase RecQ